MKFFMNAAKPAFSKNPLKTITYKNIGTWFPPLIFTSLSPVPPLPHLKGKGEYGSGGTAGR
jgi:hypothetical protein